MTNGMLSVPVAINSFVNHFVICANDISTGGIGIRRKPDN
jgi:hypothetical protein